MIARHEKGVSGAGLISVWKQNHIFCVEPGAGLMTAVQPAARAALSFRVIIADGKFQGVSMDLIN